MADAGFIDSLNVQRRVIGAVVLRELYVRFGRENFGFFWFMLEPMIFCVAVMVLWRSTRGQYEYGIYPVIATTYLGYMPMLLFRHCTPRAMNCGRHNSGILYHRQITMFDIFIARMVGEVTGNILACIFIFTVFYLVGMLQWPQNFTKMYLGYFDMVWYSVSVGLIVGALSEKSEVVEKVWQPINYINIPLSGAFMMAIWIPGGMRHYYLMVPSVSAFELIRSGYFGDTVTCFYNQTYVVVFCGLTTLLGLSMYRRARRYVVLE